MKVVYSSTVRERLPKYQILTSIVKGGDKFKVVKKPIFPEGHLHIQSMMTSFESLVNNFPNWRIARPELIAEGIEFEYIDGKTLNEILLEAVARNDKQTFHNVLSEYIERYIRTIGHFDEEWESDSLFFEFFGCYGKLRNVKTVICANLDLTFDNIIQTSHGEQVIIDYEWVVNFVVPVQYLLYRSLRRFFLNNHSYTTSFLSMEECLSSFGIGAEELDLYYQMELGLRERVYGPNLSYIIPSSHFKPVIVVQDALNVYHEVNSGQHLMLSRDYFNQDFWEVLLAPVFYELSEAKQLFIWGTGSAGIRTAEYFRERNLTPSGFIDSNSVKWGERIDGVPVWGPAYLNEVQGNAFVVIGSSYYTDIIPFLEKAGYKKGKDFTIGLIL